MNALLYGGLSALSLAIKFRTWSKYSHVSLERDNENCIEAWGLDGVVHRKGTDAYKIGHTEGTVVHVFQVPTSIQIGDQLILVDHSKIWESALEQVGKKYDWFAILGFMIRMRTENSERLVCSELFHMVVKDGGLEVQKGPSYKQSPGDIAKSAVLPYVEERIV